jgi:hypothetical protein
MADVLNKLNSANYVTVKVTDNAIVNGNNLLAAYALAKTVTPNAIALSTSNRLAIILPPARYNLGTQSLVLDTQYIDIVGSTSDRSKHYITSNVGAANRGTVQQTANDVKLYNLTIENSNITFVNDNNSSDPAAYFPNSNLPNSYLENINFISISNQSTWAMRIGINYSGTFVNCTGSGFYLFGGDEEGNASGTFTDCIGGSDSFGEDGPNGGGIFTNCTGGDYSFGGRAGTGGTLSGTFTNCTGGTYSFGGGGFIGGTLSGTFKDCTGGDASFGGAVDAGGNLTSTSVFINCTGGDYSFVGSNIATGGTISGTLTD